MRSESYRYYCLDGAGQLHDAEWFAAESDEDASAQIEAKHADATCEIWQGKRLVAKLCPQRLRAEMPSDSADLGGSSFEGTPLESVEYLLFDSLVHHLLEKGVLTKNDALSVVQTAAAVVRGRESQNMQPTMRGNALSMLERTYLSFEALPDRYVRPAVDGHNVLPLRPPLHADRPHFPSAEDD
jgi:hypothetical protein